MRTTCACGNLVVMSGGDSTLDEFGRCLLSELLPAECGCRFHATSREVPRRGRIGPAKHAWRWDDDLVVAAVYLEYGTSNVPAAVKADLAELIGCSIASVAYKLGNLHTYITDHGALANGSAQMRTVVDQLRRAGAADRERLVAAAYRRLGH